MGFCGNSYNVVPNRSEHQSWVPGLVPPGSAGLDVCPNWQENAVESGNVTVWGNAATGEEVAAASEAGGLKKLPSQGEKHGKEKAMKTRSEKAELQDQRVSSLYLLANCVLV